MSEYERQRLYTLRQLDILDTPPSEAFDRITRMACRIFDLPVAAVSLTDENRQWFKSRLGTGVTEVARYKSPCSDVSATSELEVVEDLLATDFYRDSPQAKLGMRFYAGAPLTTRDGYTLGTLCVLGPEPRTASEDELESLMDLSNMVMAQIELRHALGRTDPVTLLPNRSQFGDDLEDLARDHPDRPYHGLFVELASVVQLNTVTRVLGGGQVDLLAREGARQLEELVGRHRDLYSVGMCQYLFLRDTEDQELLKAEAEQLGRQLSRSSLWRNLAIIVRPRIGIASFLPKDAVADNIIRLAQSACQTARFRESSLAVFTPSMDTEQQRRFRLLNDMHHLLQDGAEQLRLVFQPRVALASGRCVGAEALVRWHHPELGDISPSEFIPLIENTPVAKHLTRWVLDAAIAQASTWFDQGMPLRVSANVMASNFEEAGFTDHLISRLHLDKVPADRFELELTESALVGNSLAVRKQLKALSGAGIRLAIDDFGTGYSNLAYLLNVPADIIKIDRAFTSARRSKRRESQTMMLKAMIDLAHGMGYQTVAEGFEPPDMGMTLSELGCDEAQSFAISRPLDPEAFSSWYHSRATTDVYGAGLK
ncbi:diguanylate cyclase/phosphodiesterase with GAF sensor [Marinobacter daqiaonensis]|uniref:Diguanylate cyclase/phosphodiesterase with GAF sensor n=1 Tax=Marinobacter daqiaonensis TaxID=650891 RepID=A0A1I6HHZ1_9GAMM|nr:sensor domain-containing phosphodiesterase [Marinobacter daqiaonensis]SFR54066.1 diguanylate cyclase/phosphodiesterase with GAF sensor [Marinobacter daqiaonensis]